MLIKVDNLGIEGTKAVAELIKFSKIECLKIGI